MRSIGQALLESEPGFREEMMRSARGEGRIGCILWLAVLALVGYVGYKIIPVKVAKAAQAQGVVPPALVQMSGE